jgi:hypothetical protein
VSERESVLDLDADEVERAAHTTSQHAAALHAIAEGIRIFRNEKPVFVGSVAQFVRDALASGEPVKAADLRRKAGGRKAVDRALRALVDRGEAERLGDGWYRSLPRV